MVKTNLEHIDDIGNYLANSLSKVNGFDLRWSSMISCNPLLFESKDYLHVKKMVDDRVTEEELAAYKAGKLREVYASFDYMLMCNLEYFDRIISFCTIVFYQYVRLPNGDVVDKYLKNKKDGIPIFLGLTPTQIWCCAMSSVHSTEFELKYGWGRVTSFVESRSNTKTKSYKLFPNVPNENQSWLEVNYQSLYDKNKVFQRFVEYSSFRTQTDGFRNTLLNDKCSNNRLSQLCTKFTKTTKAISVEQLDGLSSLMEEDSRVVKTLSNSIEDCMGYMFHDNKEYAVYVYENEFFIFSKKFKMSIRKEFDRNTKLPYISKQYLSNSYECFVAESLLSKSIKQQIEWAKYDIRNAGFEYERKLLEGMLLNMLKDDFRNVKCVRQMNRQGVYSEVTFQGVFKNVYIIERMYIHNVLVHETKCCMSKENAARYLVERGYYIFGTIHDVDIMFIDDLRDKTFVRQTLIPHFSKCCILVIDYMRSIIDKYKKSNNELIEFLYTKEIPPNRLSPIKYYTTLKTIVSPRTIMNEVRLITEKKEINPKKKLNYYQAINNT